MDKDSRLLREFLTLTHGVQGYRVSSIILLRQ